MTTFNKKKEELRGLKAIWQTPGRGQHRTVRNERKDPSGASIANEVFENAFAIEFVWIIQGALDNPRCLCAVIFSNARAI